MFLVLQHGLIGYSSLRDTVFGYSRSEMHTASLAEIFLLCNAFTLYAEMLDCILYFVAFITGVIILLLFWRRQGKSEYATLPPGPPKHFFVGNALQIKHTNDAGKKRMREIAKLVKQYGKNGVATLYFFHQPFVFVTELEIIKSILNCDAANGRPVTVRDIFFGHKGLIMADGELWKEQRRFAFNTLHGFTTDRNWLESIIIEEAQALVENLGRTKFEPVYPVRYLTQSVCNVICAISFGERFSHQDDTFVQIYSLIQANMKIISQNQLLDLFPILRFLPFSPFRRRFNTWLRNTVRLTEFFKSLIDRNRSDLFDGEPRNYVHAYLIEADRQKTDKDSTFTEIQLLRSIFDLFGAGTDTAASTLAFSILYLNENPKVYEKVVQEVDGVIRDGSYPLFEDKDRLPYTQATILEVQRMANLLPIAFRRTLEPISLNGFKIPAGVNVFPLLSAVHEDPKYFPEPMVFKPERFLDESGALAKNVEGFIAFSAGKRYCLGSSLAQMELYIFFVTLIKYFRFQVPPGQGVSSDDSTFSLINSPKPFLVSFDPR